MTKKLNPLHKCFSVYLGNFSIQSFETEPTNKNQAFKYFDNFIEAEIFSLIKILKKHEEKYFYSEWKVFSDIEIKKMKQKLYFYKNSCPDLVIKYI